MISSEETVENAWMRSHAQCECRRTSHDHHGQCTQKLVWENRGLKALGGAWETHPMNRRKTAGWEAVNQCEILCWDCSGQIVSEAAIGKCYREDRLFPDVPVRNRIRGSVGVPLTRAHWSQGG